MKRIAAITAFLVFTFALIGMLTSCEKAKQPEQAQKAGQAAPAQTEERVEKNPDRNAYFGEEHIHTSWSVDAWLMGNRLTGPDDALKYAQGQTIKHPMGYDIKIETPMDFMGVTIGGQPEDSKLAASLADQFMFQDYYGDRAPEAIAKEFGRQFAVSLEKLKPGSWQGPVESGYGWHLVFVDTVIPGRIPAFEEMEADVKTAWLAEQKQQAWQNAYKEMRAKYSVLLPGPPDKQAASAPAPPPKKQVPAPSGEGPL